MNNTNAVPKEQQKKNALNHYERAGAAINEFRSDIYKAIEMFYSEDGVKLIAEERQRQIEKEGWTPEHDAEHVDGELANAAAYYAMTENTIDFIDNKCGNDMHLHIWPFEIKSLKRTPENRVRELQKAGALIAAELDRLIREARGEGLF